MEAALFSLFPLLPRVQILALREAEPQMVSGILFPHSSSVAGMLEMDDKALLV